LLVSYLHCQQYPGDFGLDLFKHCGKQLESLALVFLLGIFLGVSAQVDSLP
jgi:hypothetical protein